MEYNVPILYIPFKRLDIVKQVFPQIKSIKPSKLYIAQDGPRNEEESKMLEEVMSFILENIDWDTKLHIFKSDKNNGPNLFIYKAINWFFENEEMGIIIEEDGFPSKSYFEFAKVLLEKHKNDEKVYAICGFSGFSRNEDIKCDYYYSNVNFAPWAFATWRNRWLQFDFDLRNVKSFDFINKVYGKNEIMAKIIMCYAEVIEENIEEFKDKLTWDLRFRFIIQYNDGYCIFPRQNLVKHLDFDSSKATSFHNDTWLKDIKDYVDIGEYNFNTWINCTGEVVSDRYIEFLANDILFSFISPKAYNIIENIIDNLDRIYIYGAGWFSYIFYNVYKEILEDKMIAFIDDNKKGYLMGKPIISYENMDSNANILIGITYSNQINAMLKKLENYHGNVVVIKDILKETIQ